VLLLYIIATSFATASVGASRPFIRPGDEPPLITARGGKCSGDFVMVQTFNPTVHARARIQRIIDESPKQKVFIAIHTNSEADIIAEMQSFPKSEKPLPTVVQNAMKERFGAVSELTNETMMALATTLMRTSQKELEKEMPDAVLRYSDVNILEMYPYINSIRTHGGIGHHHTVGFEFRDQAIQAALRDYFYRTGERKWNFCHLWVLNDNLEFSGKWGTFFEKYRENNADLLSSNRRNVSIDEHKFGTHSSSAFRAMMKEGLIYEHDQQIVRYSPRFLEAIHEQSNSKKVYAFSAYGTPSLAEMLGLRYGSLSLKGVKERGSWN